MVANADTFAASLNDALHLIEKLESILKEERQVLEANDLERLVVVAKHKEELLSALQRNITERREMFRTHKLSPDSEGFEGYIATLAPPIAETLREQWLRVEAKLELCKTTNLVNGKILQRSRQRVKTVLDIMRGQHNDPRLYNHSGETHSLGHHQALAKA